MSIENAKQALSEAVYQLKLVQIGFGRGAGGREVALAATNAEQAELWLAAAQRSRESEGVGGTSEAAPSGMASVNQG
jgi:hypothetical protein